MPARPCLARRRRRSAPADASRGLMLVTAAVARSGDQHQTRYARTELTAPDVPIVGLRTADPSDRDAVLITTLHASC
jgi:hypothetical protein